MNIFLVDFRKFQETSERDDIRVIDVDVAEMIKALLGKQIITLQSHFLNEVFREYVMELVVLIEWADEDGGHNIMHYSVDTPTDRTTATAFPKETEFAARDGLMIGYFRKEKSVGYVIFEDGVVWTFDSEKATVLKEEQLRLPFAKAHSVHYEAGNKLLFFCTQQFEQAFFKNDGTGWQKISYNIDPRFFINKIIGKFVIARY